MAALRHAKEDRLTPEQSAKLMLSVGQNALTSTEIRSVFSRPLPPIRTTPNYRIRLLSVLLGLATLQLLYLLLIAVIVTLTVLYIIAALGSGASLNFITIVFYVGIPSVGLIAVLFLLKPILIHSPRRPTGSIRLAPEEESVLFEVVERLCDALGSPRPTRVFADLQVNASASVHGWRGFFFGELDLTIGLPLATGLTLPQFTGVLAHEFGHFTQRAGLRSYFLIQTIQAWFSRVVYQRDNWDAWLERMCRRRDWRIKTVAHVAQQVVNFSRMYLAFLMKAGGRISTGFSRHMEYDADRCEAAIVGTGVFEQGILHLPLLQFAANLAWQDAAKDWSVRRLPEDFPALVNVRSGYLPDEVKDQIVKEALAQTTESRDTHPCASERIANVASMSARGIFDLDGPAQLLFRDLAGLCRAATRHHYEITLGIPANGARLVSTQETIASTQAAREFEQAAMQLFDASAEFCAGWFRLPEGDPRERDADGDGVAPPKLSAKAFEQALEMTLLHFAALTVVGSGVRVKPESFRLNQSDLASIREESALSTHNLDELTDQYNRSCKGIANRIETTIARLLRGDLAVQAGCQIAVPDLKASWCAYGAISACQPDVIEIRRRLCAVRIVRQNARLFAAATCANLLRDLETGALSAIDRIIARGAEVLSAVSFDDHSAATVGSQLTVTAGSATERIEAFLSRFDALASRSLAHLAWFTANACRKTEAVPSQQEQADAP